MNFCISQKVRAFDIWTGTHINCDDIVRRTKVRIEHGTKGIILKIDKVFYQCDVLFENDIIASVLISSLISDL